MQKVYISYSHNQTSLEGYAAYPSGENLPLVILCHAWKGRDEFICEKAKQIASLGFGAFALDMYGKGVHGGAIEENAALKKPFIDNRAYLLSRVSLGYETAKALPSIDPNNIAVLGFGFGGICALDLARSGVNLRGAISVYGHFNSPPNQETKNIQGKVLILHGYEDPVSPIHELVAFEKELHLAKIDWQTHLFGSAMHAFATPGADLPHAGIQYNQRAEKRAWIAIANFLDDVFLKESPCSQ